MEVHFNIILPYGCRCRQWSSFPVFHTACTSPCVQQHPLTSTPVMYHLNMAAKVTSARQFWTTHVFVQRPASLQPWCRVCPCPCSPWPRSIGSQPVLRDPRSAASCTSGRRRGSSLREGTAWRRHHHSWHSATDYHVLWPFSSITGWRRTARTLESRNASSLHRSLRKSIGPAELHTGYENTGTRQSDRTAASAGLVLLRTSYEDTF
jgi:hypothetical protein